MDKRLEREKLYLEEEKPIIEFPTTVMLFIAFVALCVGLSFVFLPWYVVLFLFFGLCLSIAVFLNLYIGILLFLMGAFFHPTYWFPELQSLHPARYLALGILFIWALHTIIYRDFRLVKVPQNFFILAFFSLAFATTFKFFDYSFPYFLEVGTKAIVLYFAIANIIRTRKEVIFLIWFLIGIGFISALAGIYQYTHNIGVYYAKEGILRVTGFAEDPNFFAMDLIVSLPLAIALFFYYRSTFIKISLAFIIFCLIVTAVLTFSRAGLVQLILVLFFSLGMRILKMKKILIAIAFSLILVAFIPFVPQKYLERAQTITKLGDPAITMRLVCWKAGLELMLEHPFKGVGFGQFRPAFFEKSITSPEIPYKGFLDAQNIFIQTGAEVGLFGLFLFLILIFWTIKYLRQNARAFFQKKDFLLAEISSALEISFIVYLLGGFFNSYLQLFIFWIIIPLAVVMKQLALRPLGKNE